MQKIIASFVICLFLLMGCGQTEEKVIPNASLGVSFPVNPNFRINVLSYKFISLVSGVSVDPPPEGKKYITLRIIWQNTAQNRGIPAFSVQNSIESIQILPPDMPQTGGNPKLAQPIDISFENLYSSIEPFEVAPSKELSAGDSMTTWIMGTVPKDLTPPFLIKFIPKQGQQMILDIK